MKNLNITVADKIATYRRRDGCIVCGNSDYQITFAFDSDWDGYDTKIARFIWNGAYKEVEFTGATCSVPIINNATEVRVGVYVEGDDSLETTTSATIPCKLSVLCESDEVQPELVKKWRDEAEKSAEQAAFAVNEVQEAGELARMEINQETQNSIAEIKEAEEIAKANIAAKGTAIYAHKVTITKAYNVGPDDASFTVDLLLYKSNNNEINSIDGIGQWMPFAHCSSFFAGDREEFHYPVESIKYSESTGELMVYYLYFDASLGYYTSAIYSIHYSHLTITDEIWEV